eukprot:scaffold45276_cov281-Isochrysis_galbana.AAC.4
MLDPPPPRPTIAKSTAARMLSGACMAVPVAPPKEWAQARCGAGVAGPLLMQRRAPSTTCER